MDADFKTQDPDTYDWDILYGGYRYDQDTGLYHVGPRIYHPSLGRWLQNDPSGYADGPNLYQYAHSSPLTFYDPSGRFGLLAVAAISFGVGFALSSLTLVYDSADKMNRALDTNDPELWAEAQEDYRTGMLMFGVGLSFVAGPAFAPLGLVAGGAADAGFVGIFEGGTDAYAQGGDFNQVVSQAATTGAVYAVGGALTGGVFRGVGFGLRRGYNRFYGPGRITSRFVGDSGLFMDANQAITRSILADATNEISIPWRVFLEEAVINPIKIALTRPNPTSHKAAATAMRQAVRLLGTGLHPGRARIRLAFGPRLPSDFANMIGRRFGINDLRIVELARQRRLSVVTTNPRLANQVLDRSRPLFHNININVIR